MSEIIPAAERELRKAAERLARLQKDPSFTMLVRECEAKRDRMTAALTNRILNGEDLVVLQRQVDYDRGFAAGMLYGKEVVDAAAAKLREFDNREATEETEETDAWTSFGEDRSA